MTQNKIILCMISFALSILSCAYGIQGAKKMEDSLSPLIPIEIKMHESIISIFPVKKENSFCMIAGKPDHETLRMVTIHEGRLKENEIPIENYEPAEEIGTCIGDCTEMFLSSTRILSLFNWKTRKVISEYWGVGETLENLYLKTKFIDEDNKIVLTIFHPYYNKSYDTILNGSVSITQEDLIHKNRIKSIPISTESGEYKKYDQTRFYREPNVFFGPNYVIYRESPEYHWLVVNNNLDSITHPLQELLNQHPVFFKSQFLSIEIAPDQPYAVAVCQDPVADKRTVAIIQWNKAPSIMPVLLELKKNEEVYEKSMTLSPSGKWTYFSTRGGVKRNHFLMYVDTNLPNGCLPPFPLTIDTEMETKATWVTAPEGFVMKVEGKLLYWDLSKFSANTFLKTREYDFLQLEKNH